VARALQNIVDGESRRGRMRHQGGILKPGVTTIVVLAASAAIAACDRDAYDPTPEASVHRTAEAAHPRDAYRVAVEQAEGAHRVAMERCEALAGSAQRACRERAGSELERARTDARRARDGDRTDAS
jgi:hypothetical protein